MFTRALQKIGQTPALALFRNRPFALLWLAQMISNLGDYALSIVVPVTVYKATGSKTALGISFICGTLPALLFSLLGGVLADRWPQKRTLITADVARMGAILLLLLVANPLHFGPHDLSLFYVVSFLVASFSCFFSPARQSLMRFVVPKEHLVQANSLVFTGTQATWLLGPAIGGLLLAYLSPKSVFVFDSATFAVSALLIAVIKIAKDAQIARNKPPRGPKGVWEDAREGILYITSSPILRPGLTMLLLAVAASQITNTLEFPFVRDLWHGSPQQFAGLISLGFGGAMLAGVAGSGLLRTTPPSRLLLTGFTIMGLAGLAFSLTTGLVVGGALLFVSCVGNGIGNIGNLGLFQRNAPPDLQGRVSATISLCVRGAMTVGGLLTVGLTTLVPGSGGLRPIFAGVAVVHLLCGALAWVTLRHLSVQDIAEAARKNAAPDTAEPSRA